MRGAADSGRVRGSISPQEVPMRVKTLLLAASLLTAMPALAAPSGPYDRAVARAQLESMLRVAEQQGRVSPAKASQFRSTIAARPENIDLLARVISSEGVDIGIPGSNLAGAALIDAIIAKMSDGRGSIEAAISTTGPTRISATPGNLSSILPTAGVSTTIRTPEAPGVRSTSSSSMAGFNPFQALADLIFGNPDDNWEKERNAEAAQAAADRQKAEKEPKTPAPKACDPDETPSCGHPVFSGGGANPKRPDPTGETRAKPSQLSPGEVAGALGGKQGQVTNPAPDDAGSGNFTGGSGAIPAVRGGGVSNPGTAPVTGTFTTLPGKTLPAAPQVVDPVRGDAPGKPATDGQPGQPSTPKPSQPGGN
jgi:hypothetical protein